MRGTILLIASLAALSGCGSDNRAPILAAGGAPPSGTTCMAHYEGYDLTYMFDSIGKDGPVNAECSVNNHNTQSIRTDGQCTVVADNGDTFDMRYLPANGVVGVSLFFVDGLPHQGINLTCM